MYSYLEETLQKLDWVESECHFDLRMGSEMCISLLRKSEEDVFSCGLGLRSNNNVYSVSLNRFSMKKADGEDYFFVTPVEDKNSKPVKLLSKVYPGKVQEFRDASLDCIENVKEKDVKEINYFQEKYGELQKDREIFSGTHVADNMGRKHVFRADLREFLSSGKYSQKLQLYFDEVTEKVIGWLVLEQTAKNCADDLLEFVKHHKQRDNKEIAEQIDEISGFYRNLAYYAHYGGERMRAFQNEVFDVYYLDSSELKPHKIEEIKKTILSKISF